MESPALQVKAASSLVVSHGFVDGIPRIFGASYPYVFIVTSILGLAVFQTGLQRSRVAVVAPLTNTIASVYVVCDWDGDFWRVAPRFASPDIAANLRLRSGVTWQLVFCDGLYLDRRSGPDPSSRGA